MKLSVLTRKLHYWVSAIITLPVLVILCTGLLLQLKKEVAWIQPVEHRGAGTVPSLGFDALLGIVRAIPEAEVVTWDDIHRLDVRPDRGIIKVTARNRWEVQVDAALGTVLQVAYRRSDLIESLHDGSWFHDVAKLWIFLPSGALLLFLLVTGIYLFAVPFLAKRRRRLSNVQ